MTTDPTPEPEAARPRPRGRGVYLLPNLFTTAGLFSGFYAIVAATDGKLAAAGVSTGCASNDPATALNEALYCPDDRVTRQAMAAFIVRAKFGDHFSYTQTPYFSDVPATHSFFKYIQKMRDAGFTTGCNQTGTLYCPSGTLTRQAMAVFIVREVRRALRLHPDPPFHRCACDGPVLRVHPEDAGCVDHHGIRRRDVSRGTAGDEEPDGGVHQPCLHERALSHPR